MSKYRKKPVVIDAFQLRPFNAKDDWFVDAIARGDVITHFAGGAYRGEPVWCEIKTLEGTMIAHEGDYIIRGVNGEIYPCKEDIFHQTYEEVEQ